MSGLTSELARRGSAKERVLAALVAAGPAGVTSVALNDICYRYGARIHELRDAGHRISDAERVSPGVYRYTYLGRPDMPERFVPPVGMPVYTTAKTQRLPKPGEQGGLF